MSENATAEARIPSSGETIAGALACFVLGNLAIVLAAGGYEISAIGLQVRSPGRPLGFLLALLAVRAALTWRRAGRAAALSGLLTLGVPAAVLAAIVFYTVQTGRAADVPAWAAAAVWGMGLVGFVLAWISWPPPLGTARIVVVLVYIGASAALAGSLRRSGDWERTFNLRKPRLAADTIVPADRAGLLAGRGLGVSFEKKALDYDWRDTAIVEAGGFFSDRASWSAGSRLVFEVARTEDAARAEAKVTLVGGSHEGVQFERSVRNLSSDSWERVSIDLQEAGGAEVVFEVVGDEGRGAVLFANPRIMDPAVSTDALNIILIVVDTLRADRMGLYGYEKPTTPELEAVAASAVVFDGSLSQSSWTRPTMGTLYTSLHPSAHGSNSWEQGLSFELATFATRLRDAGYHTAALQSNRLMGPEPGFAQGFARYVHYPSHRPSALNPDRHVRAERINREALEWLDKTDERPFLLYLHYMDVHDPYVPPQEFRRFGTDSSGLYDGEIAYFSRKFAELYEELQERGLLEDSVIILTSDHGEQFWEHGSYKHGLSLYNEEVGVPLIIWHPDAAPARIASRTSTVDIAPTIIDIAGAAPIADAAGISLMPAVAGEPLEKRGVFCELHTIYPPGQHLVSLTEGDMRLIVSNPEVRSALRFELYDLAADPAEQINLASSMLEERTAMFEKVRAFLEAQAALHIRLVPEEFHLPLTEERIRDLEALGYLN